MMIPFQRATEGVEEYILRTLVYYDIFNYPLTLQEIFRFSGLSHITEDLVSEKLTVLCEDGVVFHWDGFFSIQNKIENINRRIKGNQEAEKYLVLAKDKAKLIMKFPFVRGVMASGSLSKGYMDADSDLDFFIITEPGRLWVARMLLVLYKRVFLGNSHKHFCVNYFVDTSHLEIDEKNLFTATELATVIPLYGTGYYENLMQENQWLKTFFPNYKPRSTANIQGPIKASGKHILERLINLFFAEVWNRLFMYITLQRWKRNYEKTYSAADFQVAFKTKTHASKNHPRNYQRKVMELYEVKLITMKNKLAS